jgi:energy-coupling factor transporter ATP-binding protein EcfA2
VNEKAKTVEIENLGPIQEFTFKLDAPGVTAIVAPNGFGKSILIESLAGVAAGEGGLPLRHGTDKGRIDGLGVHVSINPKQTRCAGEFAVDHLEGKLNLATLVDPGLKDELAADKRRIKALISLTGVEADRHLFDSRPEFDAEEFESIVTTEALKTNDLIDMAAKIARDYQAEARSWERGAEKDEFSSKALRDQIASVDMTQESDSEKLQEVYFEAQQAYLRAGNKQRRAVELRESADAARAELITWDSRDVPSDATEANAAVQAAIEKQGGLVSHRDELVIRLHEIEKSIELCDREIQTAEAEIRLAQDNAANVQTHVMRRTACLKAIADSENFEAPNDEKVEALKQAFHTAKEAMEAGVMVRDAKMKQHSVEAFDASAQARREKAERLRKAATGTDTVLSEAIESKWVKVVTEGTAKRVYGYVASKDLWGPYHELSATEKWAIAIEIGVERVGQGGLLFIPQEAWEGVDVWNRKFIHEHAKARGVFILTAEATRDESDGREMKAHSFNEGSAESVSA